MREALVDRFCASLPGAAPCRPLGDDLQVWTIGGRMFAAYVPGGEGVSVHSADAEALIAHGRAKSVSYLRAQGWVVLPWSTRDAALRARLSASYHAVRRGLGAAIEADIKSLGPPIDPGARIH